MPKVQNYSNEALDIIGKVPNIFVRYGLSFLIIILIGIGISFYYIRYNDYLHVPVKVYWKKTEYSEMLFWAYGELQANDLIYIHKNQKVEILLNDYSYDRYGILYGEVLNVSKLDSLFSYKIVIRINTESTNDIENVMIKSLQIPEGNAIIKGKEQNLYQRIFFN